MVIGIPIGIICLWPIAHIMLTVCSCIKKFIMPNGHLHGRDHPSVHRSGNSTLCLEIVIIFCFSIIFLTIYPTAMYITEVYFATTESLFPFMLLKYCIGSLQLIISPLCLLLIKKDIRKGASLSYMKKSTQNDDAEITFEELQEHLGIGVQVGN